MQISSSPAGSLNSIDWFKGIRGAAITYIAGLAIQVLVDLQAYLQACHEKAATCQLDFGVYDFLIPGLIALLGFVMEMARRWRTDHAGR